MNHLYTGWVSIPIFVPENLLKELTRNAYDLTYILFNNIEHLEGSLDSCLGLVGIKSACP